MQQYPQMYKCKKILACRTLFQPNLLTEIFLDQGFIFFISAHKDDIIKIKMSRNNQCSEQGRKYGKRKVEDLCRMKGKCRNLKKKIIKKE